MACKGPTPLSVVAPVCYLRRARRGEPPSRRPRHRIISNTRDATDGPFPLSVNNSGVLLPGLNRKRMRLLLHGAAGIHQPQKQSVLLH